MSDISLLLLLFSPGGGVGGGARGVGVFFFYVSPPSGEKNGRMHTQTGSEFTGPCVEFKLHSAPSLESIPSSHHSVQLGLSTATGASHKSSLKVVFLLEFFPLIPAPYFCIF